MVKAKILLQRVWEVGVDWDQDIPQYIAEEWLRWRMELKLLSKKHISRYYFHEDASIKELQLHGFCDASENAHASVVYLRMTLKARCMYPWCWRRPKLLLSRD